MSPRTRPLNNITALYLVCLRDREVLKITVQAAEEEEEEQEDRLEPGQWSFRLVPRTAPDHGLFRAQMGDGYSGIEWDVRLGRDASGRRLWQTAKKSWSVDYKQWE